MMLQRETSVRIRQKIRITWALLLVQLFCLPLSAGAVRPSRDTMNRTAYAWSDLNHYEILNLNSTSRQRHLTQEKRKAEREAVRKPDVKRAYYAQAKRHHPDKAAVPNNDVSDGGRRPLKMSIDERTARMARIAGAYEVLYNEKEKKKYDRVLHVRELTEEMKDQYAADMGKKRCKRDSDCDTAAGECCIQYHFEFCGVLSSYAAAGLECSGPPVRTGNA